MKITNDKGSMNRIINDDRIKNYENIELTTLDALLKNRKNISMIKIDLEGYEKQVFLGAENTLENKNLDVIIIELNDSNKYYDYDEEETIKILERYGFKPYQFDYTKRKLNELKKKKFQSYNTIFIKNLNNVKRKLGGKIVKLKGNYISINYNI